MILTKKMLFVKPWFLFAILAILITAVGVFSSGWIVPMQSQIADARYAFLKENADKVNTNLKLSGYRKEETKTLLIKTGKSC
jgi:lipopolysaccharide export LptBFGC system permease protein LptF